LHVTVDFDAGNLSGTFTVYLIAESGQTTLGTLDGSDRTIQTFQANKPVKEFSIRIAGTTSEVLTVHEISARVYIPEEEIE